MPRLPCHTTGHAGPHPAVRRDELRPHDHRRKAEACKGGIRQGNGHSGRVRNPPGAMGTSPSTPLAPRRFICRQVSMRNAGVSRCANDVKRSVRSFLALAAICSSCVDIRLLLLSVGDVSLAQPLDLLRRFPLCAAFPRSEYYQRFRLPRRHWLPCRWSFQSAYSINRRSRPWWISQVP